MNAELQAARDLAARFGGDTDNVEVPIGVRHAWGWADAVLEARLPAELEVRNPYEFAAYDRIRDSWDDAARAVEAGVPGADEKLTALLDRFSNWIKTPMNANEQTIIKITGSGDEWEPADHRLADELLACCASEDAYDQEPDGSCFTLYTLRTKPTARIRRMVEAAPHADYFEWPQPQQWL